MALKSTHGRKLGTRVRLVLGSIVHPFMTGALLTESFLRLLSFAARGRPELNSSEAEVFAKVERTVIRPGKVARTGRNGRL